MAGSKASVSRSALRNVSLAKTTTVVDTSANVGGNIRRCDEQEVGRVAIIRERAAPEQPDRR
jgi:hypothetical protein